MIEVYHLNDEAFFNESPNDSETIDKRYYDVNIGFKPEKQLAAAVELFNDGYYKLVAKVNTKDLEKAWEKTNNIDSSWLENFGVKSSLKQARSSKVGDIMKDDAGNYFVISSIGFMTIPFGCIEKKTA